MLEIIILIVSIVVNTALGLLVFVNNPKKDVNRLFFGLTLSLSIWSAISYLSLHPTGLPQIYWVRLVLGTAAIQDFFVLASFAVFPNEELKHLKHLKAFAYYLFFVFVLTQTPFVFKSLNSSDQPIVAPGIIFFMILIFGYLGAAIYLLFKKFKSSSGAARNQLRVVIIGVVSCFAAIVFTNFFLVQVFKNTSLINFAPALTLILTSAMSYAILKHHLFNIRLFAVRATAYFLSFSALALFYVVPSILLMTFVLDIHLKAYAYFVLSVVTLFTSLLFQPIRSGFNKLTSRFFYRDYYEPQDVLDQISNLLAASVNVDEITSKTKAIIGESIHPSFTSFLLLADKDESDEKQRELLKLLSEVHADTAITDELGGSKRENLHQALSSENIAISVRLRTKKEQLGYMVLGFKQSGSPYSATDMKLLGIIADEIAVGLQNALRFREIQRFNLTLQEKIDEATKELRSANAKLKQLDKTKDEFISMASHQLRTPLTSIKGYLSLILDGDVGEVKPKQQEMIQQAFDSASRMVYLIADLLNVSRLQSGKFVIINKPSNLAEVVEGEYKQLADQAKNRQIKLIYEKPADFPVLNIDEDKVRQVVMNLMDNALYYTPAGGTVTVELSATPTEVTYKVTDTGVGVPKSVQHHLFSKFYRADNAKQMRPDGTGLGLYMTKKVITAQGGAIIFSSAEGKGSTFGFSLPRIAIEVKG